MLKSNLRAGIFFSPGYSHRNEGVMPTRALRLNYPPSLLRRPIINQIILDFEVSVNIIQAQISLEEGWIEIEMTGEDQEIRRSTKWLREVGIDVIEMV
jgi:ABC-type methionine transport system ATPase subunit